MRARLPGLLGVRVERLEPVSRGYTPAERSRVWLADGSSVFVKLAAHASVRERLRREAGVYEVVSGDFLPRCLAFEDAEDAPLLVLEDLGEAGWPPPWDEGRVDAVLAALADVHSLRPPLAPYDRLFPDRGAGWVEVSRDPEPFLSLGLASGAWLERALPTLLREESAVATHGDCLTHWDVRSDNVCFVAGRAVLVDWDQACLSNPELDLGFWLPSLQAEGGPRPERILPDAPGIAAWVSGFFAARAGLPDVRVAPRVRAVQLAQLRTALPWAVRELDLSPPRARRRPGSP